jgi:hypothetical protein
MRGNQSRGGGPAGNGSPQWDRGGRERSCRRRDWFDDYDSSSDIDNEIDNDQPRAQKPPSCGGNVTDERSAWTVSSITRRSQRVITDNLARHGCSRHRHEFDRFWVSGMQSDEHGTICRQYGRRQPYLRQDGVEHISLRLFLGNTERCCIGLLVDDICIRLVAED